MSRIYASALQARGPCNAKGKEEAAIYAIAVIVRHPRRQSPSFSLRQSRWSVLFSSGRHNMNAESRPPHVLSALMARHRTSQTLSKVSSGTNCESFRQWDPIHLWQPWRMQSDSKSGRQSHHWCQSHHQYPRPQSSHMPRHRDPLRHWLQLPVCGQCTRLAPIPGHCFKSASRLTVSKRTLLSAFCLKTKC